MHSSDPKLPEVRCRSSRAETLQDQFSAQIQPTQARLGPKTRVFRPSHAPTVTQVRSQGESRVAMSRSAMVTLSGAPAAIVAFHSSKAARPPS